MKNPFVVLFRRKNATHPTEPNRHAKRNWKKHQPAFSFSKTMLALVLAFLFIPLFVIIFFSFNESKDTTFTNFSLVWYQKLFFESRPLWQSLLNSFIIAITSSLVATILGTMAAIGNSWYKFWGKKYRMEN